MNLTQKHCLPCEVGTEPFNSEKNAEYLKEAPGWKISRNQKSIGRKFKFKSFAKALDFVNKVGTEAEKEGHHPDIELGWGYVNIKSTTHSISGLSENDFILAAKINSL